MKEKKQENPRAAHFKKARLQRYNEIAEDYTELIAELSETQEKIRVKDLAEAMGVSHVNVVKTVKKLVRDGYLKEEIELTAKGKAMAKFSKRKHEILFAFLQKLGVPEEIAAGDVEGIEHHISPETLNALEKLLKRL